MYDDETKKLLREKYEERFKFVEVVEAEMGLIGVEVSGAKGASEKIGIDNSWVVKLDNGVVLIPDTVELLDNGSTRIWFNNMDR